MLAVLLDAIETREDQPSKDRLALTPIVGECEELDRVTVRGCVSLRVCGASGCAAFWLLHRPQLFSCVCARDTGINSLWRVLSSCWLFCLFPLSAHVEQLRVFFFLWPVLLLVVEYLFVAPLAGAARGGVGGALL